MAYLRAGRSYLLVVVLVLVGGWIAWAALPPFVLQLQLSGAFAEASEESGEPLSPVDVERYGELTERPLHAMTNVELAEYMDLRNAVLEGQLPDPASDMAHYALKALGQPFRLYALTHHLGESDCVTFTETCIALACTDNWRAAYKLQSRLRYNGGQAKSACRNRESISEWIPHNAWLFDDITATLGTPLVEFEVNLHAARVAECVDGPSEEAAALGHTTVVSSYIPREYIPGITHRLATGDVIFVISRYMVRNAYRPRCIHQAMLYRDGPTLTMLHSSPPAASQWTLDRLFSNSSILGLQIVRLKPNARQVVAGEFARLEIELNVPPEKMDERVRRFKGEFLYVTPTREVDETFSHDGVLYGVIDIRPGETLWRLFRQSWRSVTNLEINQDFMARYPDLRMEDYAGDRIYVPLGPAGE